MVKKRRTKTTRIKSKKRRLHPIIIAFLSLFPVMLLAVTVTAYLYNSSPTQQVAGASTASDSANHKFSPSITPTQSSCTIMTSVIGYQACTKDSYRYVTATCGDGTMPKISTTQECKSLTAWLVQLAQACKNHSSCDPKTTSPTPTPKHFPTPSHFNEGFRGR